MIVHSDGLQSRTHRAKAAAAASTRPPAMAKVSGGQQNISQTATIAAASSGTQAMINQSQRFRHGHIPAQQSSVAAAKSTARMKPPATRMAHRNWLTGTP